MIDFIRGELISIKIGAEYGGHIWDQWLTFTHRSGTELRVFDRSYIAKDIRVGETYELILVMAVLYSVTILHEDLISSHSNKWQGLILDVDWYPSAQPSRDYRWYDSPFLSVGEDRSGFVLVQTPFGNALMSLEEVEREINASVEAGMHILWNKPRLDLLAVVA